MSTKLADQSCIPCRGGVDRLGGEEILQHSSRLGGGWAVIDGHHLERSYPFKDFRGALDFTNHVGAIAEKEGHHPEITLAWVNVTIRLWTHKVGGLTENDFILAAKIDQVFPGLETKPIST